MSEKSYREFIDSVKKVVEGVTGKKPLVTLVDAPKRVIDTRMEATNPSTLASLIRHGLKDIGDDHFTLACADSEGKFSNTVYSDSCKLAAIVSEFDDDVDLVALRSKPGAKISTREIAEKLSSSADRCVIIYQSPVFEETLESLHDCLLRQVPTVVISPFEEGDSKKLFIPEKKVSELLMEFEEVNVPLILKKLKEMEEKKKKKEKFSFSVEKEQQQ